jgi:hypothetical protein
VDCEVRFGNNYHPADPMGIEEMKSAVNDGGTGLTGSKLHGFFY